MDLGLKDRKALLTGGSKGLGRAIAEELAGEGARVAICAGHEDDVTDPEQVRGFVTRAAEALGGVAILVNNAGRAHPGSFATLTDEDWRADLDVNLFSMIRCSREALPHMRERGGGGIINVTPSTAATPIRRSSPRASFGRPASPSPRRWRWRWRRTGSW